jgi:hypothetical protein
MEDKKFFSGAAEIVKSVRGRILTPHFLEALFPWRPDALEGRVLRGAFSGRLHD